MLLFSFIFLLISLFSRTYLLYRLSSCCCIWPFSCSSSHACVGCYFVSCCLFSSSCDAQGMQHSPLGEASFCFLSHFPDQSLQPVFLYMPVSAFFFASCCLLSSACDAQGMLHSPLGEVSEDVALYSLCFRITASTALNTQRWSGRRFILAFMPYFLAVFRLKFHGHVSFAPGSQILQEVSTTFLGLMCVVLCVNLFCDNSDIFNHIF